MVFPLLLATTLLSLSSVEAVGDVVSIPLATYPSGNPACARRSDCSDHGDCINAECHCDVGWEGANCSESSGFFCIYRKDCNDHGDCVNGECRCQSGWSGAACETEACSLQCEHGGRPDSMCTSCECIGGWEGQLCDTWNNSFSVQDMGLLLGNFAQISADTQAEVVQKYNPIPGGLGLGVDVGKWAFKLPYVQMSYSNPSKAWTTRTGITYHGPDQSTFELIPGMFSHGREGYAFRDERDYANVMDGFISSRNLVGGLFETLHSVMDVFDVYFTGTESMASAQLRFPIYEQVLPYDPSDHMRHLNIEKHSLKALEALPDDCNSSEHAAMYRDFVDIWGTHYATTVRMGGIVEIVARFPSTLLDTKSKADIQHLILEDISHLVEKGPGPSDDAWIKSRTLETVRFNGGNPELGHLETIEEWIDSIETNPIVVQFELSDISDIVKNIEVKACLQQTVQRYLEEQQQSRMRELRYASVTRAHNLLPATSTTGYYSEGCPVGSTYNAKTAQFDCPSAYFMTGALVKYRGSCKGEGDPDDGGQIGGMEARCQKVYDYQGQSGNGTTRVEAGYPNGIHKHTNLESQCPVGHFVEGVVVDFRGTMHGKCDHDGAAAGSVRFQCRKFTDFLTEKQFMDGPCRTTTSTPSFANAVYSWKTGIRATCSDGQLVTGMSVLHGGSCHNRCDGDMCPMRQITLHCRNVSDYFCPLF